MYIIIDGIDGSGKSSLIAHLGNRLRKTGFIPINLVEPSFGKYGLGIRKILSSSRPRDIEREREIFTRDRADHVETTITPLLGLSNASSKFVIIQDRGYLSYPAYQAVNDDEIEAMLDEQIKIAQSPDYFFVLDIDPATALQRISADRDGPNLLEKKSILEDARRRFKIACDYLGDTARVIDADRNMDVLTDEILDIMGMDD